MLRVLVGLSALLLLAAPAWAAPASLSTEATVRAAPDGVEADYRLSRPVARFAFARKVAEIREEGWTLSPGLRWDGEAVVAEDGGTFRAFQVRVRPDTRQRDRVYPALTRIGTEGWMLYEPYFSGAEAQGPTRLRRIAPKGWARLPTARSDRPRGGFSYLGPAAYVAAGRAPVVAGPDVPAWLMAVIRGRAEALNAYYTRRLGIALPTAPLMLVSHTPGQGGGFRGDVTAGPAVSLRFHGDPWIVEDATAARGVAAFVGHEYFHFWNGALFNPRESDRESWLHEGAAEYVSLLAAMELGDLDDAGMKTALGRRLSACADVLSDRSLAEAPPRGGSGVYDCGVVASWAADLQVRAASGGARDVVDLWAELFRTTGKDRVYGVAEFTGLLRPAAGSPWSRLMASGGGEQRWPELVSALRGLGAEATASRSPDKDRAVLIFHLMGLSCGGGEDPVGFFGDPDRLTLDGPATCGPLKSGMVVDALEGRSLLTDASAAFDVAREACANGGTVSLSFQGKPVGAIACNQPLGPPPPAWTVTRWR